jgi:hypothetical protein
MDNEAAYTFYLDMPREKAWGKLGDFTLAPNYVPGVTKVEITTDQKEGVGASRRVYPKKMDETIVQWDDGYGFVLKLHKGDGGPPAPFKEAGFRYSIEDDGKGTKFNIGLMYNMQMGAFGSLLNRLFLGKIVENIVRDIGLSMKHFYETDEPVTPKTLKKLKAKS